MNRRLNELHLRRGRLLERIATQRASLGRDTLPVRASLYRADRLIGGVRSVADYLKQHPSVMGLAVAALFIIKRDRAWRWAKRGFFAWRTWRLVRDKFLEFGLRAGL
jgi:hypothetical protein